MYKYIQIKYLQIDALVTAMWSQGKSTTRDAAMSEQADLILKKKKEIEARMAAVAKIKETQTEKKEKKPINVSIGKRWGFKGKKSSESLQAKTCSTDANVQSSSKSPSCIPPPPSLLSQPPPPIGYQPSPSNIPPLPTSYHTSSFGNIPPPSISYHSSHTNIPLPPSLLQPPPPPPPEESPSCNNQKKFTPFGFKHHSVPPPPPPVQTTPSIPPPALIIPPPPALIIPPPPSIPSPPTATLVAPPSPSEAPMSPTRDTASDRHYVAVPPPSFDNYDSKPPDIYEDSKDSVVSERALKRTFKEEREDDLPSVVIELAQMVAVSGDDLENVARESNKNTPELEFLHDINSSLYIKYRAKVEEIKRGVMSDDKKAVKFVKAEDNIKSESDSPAEPKKKRKSRWGGKDESVPAPATVTLPTSLSAPGLVIPTALGAPVAPVAPVALKVEHKPQLSPARAQNKSLLAYAQRVFGSLDLDEGQWKQCEEQLKVCTIITNVLFILLH